MMLKGRKFLVSVLVILAVIVAFTISIRYFSDMDSIKFYKNLNSIIVTENHSMLTTLKSSCDKAIEENTDYSISTSFVKVQLCDNKYHISYHILTSEREYVVFSFNESTRTSYIASALWGNYIWVDDLDIIMNPINNVKVSSKDPCTLIIS